MLGSMKATGSGIKKDCWKPAFNYTWNKNVEIYQEAFKDKFILINNNPEDARKEFNSNLLQPYLEDATAKGKPKTPEEQAKSDQQFQELISDIENMVGDLPKFDTIDTAKSKIKSFI